MRLATVDFKAAFEVGMNAGENFDQGAFARAIFSGQHMNLAGTAFELDILQNGNRPESFGDAGHAYQRRRIGTGFGHYLFFCSLRKSSSGPRL
jgi:hypothetical protein